MPTRRVMKSALAGFLGTFTSRYSDYRGFWLFGFLVPFEPLVIDLLASEPTAAPPEATPIRFCQWRARTAFQDQIAKAGLPMAAVHSATMTLEATRSVVGTIEDRVAHGFELSAQTEVTMDTGAEFQAATKLFVAPQNPTTERRSTR